MLQINEKSETWSQFLKPALLVSVLFIVLVEIISLLLKMFKYALNIKENDVILANLELLTIVYVIVTLILYSFIIPWLRIKETKHSSLNKISLIKTFFILCATICLIILTNLFFLLVAVLFKVDLVSNNSISLNETHVNNSVAVFLFFVFGIVIGPFMEEILYRRILIPYLESRGMTSFYAIVCSSIAFSITHVPDDIINTNISSTMIHLASVFILGFACGLTYIITRNIFYPIIIHGLTNVSTMIPYFLNLDSSKYQQLIENVQIVQGILVLIGLLVLFYGFLKYTEIPTYANWVKVLKEESKNNVYLGLLGFIVITIILIFVTSGLSYFLIDPKQPFNNNIVALSISLGIFLAILIFVLLLMKNMEYTSKVSPFVEEEKENKFIFKNMLVNEKDIVIEVKELCKYYGEVKAVEKLNFKVKKGEIYGLLGPNGSGKSTTMRSILGLHVIDGGEISVLGYNPIMTPEQIKNLVGYVAEDPILYESMTVEDLLNFVVSLRKLNQEEANSIANKYLEALDAKKYYKKIIGTLSRGNKQKIQIICALLHQPKILIVDEPLSGLDTRSALIIKEIFQILKEKGGSIILSTHIMEQAQVLCDRIGIINKGSLVAEGTYDELRLQAKTSSSSLEEVFLLLTEQEISTNGLIQTLRG